MKTRIGKITEYQKDINILRGYGDLAPTDQITTDTLVLEILIPTSTHVIVETREVGVMINETTADDTRLDEGFGTQMVLIMTIRQKNTQ